MMRTQNWAEVLQKCHDTLPSVAEYTVSIRGPRGSHASWVQRVLHKPQQTRAGSFRDMLQRHRELQNGLFVLGLLRHRGQHYTQLYYCPAKSSKKLNIQTFKLLHYELFFSGIAI